MTLKDLFDFAYEYCEEYGLITQCDELSYLTASWDYKDFKDEPLENLKILNKPLSNGCPENLISREAALKEAYSITINGDSFDVVQVETLMALPSKPCLTCVDCEYSRCWYRERKN